MLWNVPLHKPRERPGPTILCNAFVHLAGSFVGESEGQHLPGGVVVFEQIGNFEGEHAGLARSRAGDHQQRLVASANASHWLALSWDCQKLSGRTTGESEGEAEVSVMRFALPKVVLEFAFENRRRR